MVGALPGIARTRQVAEYMRQLFHHQPNYDPVTMPDWDLPFLKECHFMVNVVKQAQKNHRKTVWSAPAYVTELRDKSPRCTGRNERLEAKLMEAFPPIESELTEENRPAVVTDSEGRILLWYLPWLLSQERQSQMWSSFKILEKQFEVKQGTSNWRAGPEFFYDESWFQYEPGTLSFAIAWFQQAMETTMGLEVSSVMRRKPGQDWIQEISDTAALLGGLTALINPSVFEAGVECLQRMAAEPDSIAKNERLTHILSHWTSPFTALSLMSNRQTPQHRDNGAGYTSMDLLVSLGNYQDGWFIVPGLGYKFYYGSGTVVGLCGRVVRHGARATGERVCWAQYLRENVLNDLHVEEPDWVYLHEL